MHKVKIRLGKPTDGYVEIDGRPIYCRSIKVEADIKSYASIILELVGEVEIEGDAAVIVDETSIGSQFKSYKHFREE